VAVVGSARALTICSRSAGVEPRVSAMNRPSAVVNPDLVLKNMRQLSECVIALSL